MKIVIIGNHCAGLTAAETIRRKDKDSSITIISNEDVPPYSIVAGNPAQVIQKIDKKKVLPENYSITKLSSEPGFYEY